MFKFPLSLNPEEFTEELVEINRQAIEGIKTLSQLREEDIQVGFSEKEAVFQEDHVVLYHYKPLVEDKDVFPIPLLISYALVNRPYMTDLQENRSLIRNLLKQGIDVYLIDWGYPKRNDQWLTLDDYINGYIDSCVDYVRQAHNLDSVNLLGICQGGVFSLCYATIHPKKVKNLITMVTSVDFHGTDGLLNTWIGCERDTPAMDPDLMVDALGNVPGDFMNFGFLMLKPFELNVQKYMSLIDIMDDPNQSANFLRMEKWIFDSPDQAGIAWSEFVKEFFIGNKLISGNLEIGGHKVNLKELKMPILNLYAEKDHLVPPASSIALGDYVGTKDYTIQGFPVGHIGMYVSGRVQNQLPPLISDWIKERK